MHFPCKECCFYLYLLLPAKTSIQINSKNINSNPYNFKNTCVNSKVDACNYELIRRRVMVDMQSALQVTSDDPTGGKESGVASSKSQVLFKGCRGCCEWVAFKVKFQVHGKVP